MSVVSSKSRADVSPSPFEFIHTWAVISRMHRLGEAVVAGWEWEKRGKRLDEHGLPLTPDEIPTGHLTLLAKGAIQDAARASCLDVAWECQIRRDDDKKANLDAVFFRNSAAGGREPVIALELEGNIDGTKWEVGNLRSYAAPLKVLITYLRPSWQSRKLIKDWLQLYEGEYRRLPGRGQHVGEFLVIFCTPNGDWKYYRHERETGSCVELTVEQGADQNMPVRNLSSPAGA